MPMLLVCPTPWRSRSRGRFGLNGHERASHRPSSASGSDGRDRPWSPSRPAPGACGRTNSRTSAAHSGCPCRRCSSPSTRSIERRCRSDQSRSSREAGHRPTRVLALAYPLTADVRPGPLPVPRPDRLISRARDRRRRRRRRSPWHSRSPEGIEPSTHVVSIDRARRCPAFLASLPDLRCDRSGGLGAARRRCAHQCMEIWLRVTDHGEGGPACQRRVRPARAANVRGGHSRSWTGPRRSPGASGSDSKAGDHGGVPGKS